VNRVDLVLSWISIHLLLYLFQTQLIFELGIQNPDSIHPLLDVFGQAKIKFGIQKPTLSCIRVGYP
jgi:hypothetical protein